jgi:hypothetical protein
MPNDLEDPALKNCLRLGYFIFVKNMLYRPNLVGKERTALNAPTKHIYPRRRGFKSSPAHHWSENFLQIRHQLYTSNSSIILNFNQSANFKIEAMRILNIIISLLICPHCWGTDLPLWITHKENFKYTSCYFKVVTLFIRNLFRVRLPYLLLLRG